MDASGFGDKNVMVEDDDTSVEFLEKIYSSYPKLRNIGGIEFLRVGKNKRQLESIPISEHGYNAKCIKRGINAGRLIVRPIQTILKPIYLLKPV